MLEDDGLFKGEKNLNEKCGTQLNVCVLLTSVFCLSLSVDFSKEKIMYLNKL